MEENFCNSLAYIWYRPALLYTFVTVSVFGPISKISRSLGRIFKIPFPFISLPDKNWSLLDTFDSITPSHQSGHEPYEVFSWFKNSGFKNIEPTNLGNTSWKGYKSRKKWINHYKIKFYNEFRLRMLNINWSWSNLNVFWRNEFLTHQENFIYFIFDHLVYKTPFYILFQYNFGV